MYHSTVYTISSEERKNREMCNRCDSKAVVKPWKVSLGIAVSIVILVITQVFVYGQFTQSTNDHIAEDLTYKEMTEEFVTQREFQMLIKSMDEKLETITNFITKEK